jgi:hypothetical protein
MSKVKHAKLAEYIRRHKKNWDLDCMVVMPGEAGNQLFREYPLSDQSVVGRAYGRKGGLAGEGKPKTGGRAKGMPNTGKAAKGMPNTGKAAKGMPNTGKAAKGMAKTGKQAAKGVAKTGKAAKGMAKTGRAAKGAAHWNTGVMETPQDLLLAFQQEVLGL